MYRIGTDCSGIEAPIAALRQLQIPYQHMWSSDIDKYVIQSIKANYEPEILFGDPDGPYPDGDITKRDNSILPDIDLYVAGFPCQPFSNAGQRKGFNDKRGNVFWSCLDVIKTKRPKYFILENVKALISHQKGHTWRVIWSSLQIEGYTTKWKVLNTKDYGIPQNRQRVFIVGKRDGDFHWPEHTEMDDLKGYVDHSNTIRQEWKRKTKVDLEHSPVFIDVDFLHYTNYPNANTVCPCVLARPSSLWCVTYNRYCTCKELLSLQGFTQFKQVVSNSQLKKQIGNSMSVNVITAILNELL